MKIEKIKKRNIVEKKYFVVEISCDECNKNIENGNKYIDLFIGSPYPECDGNDYQFCCKECFSEFIKTSTEYDRNYYNKFEFKTFKLPSGVVE